MTVKFNQNLGVYQVNGRGAYATEADAKAAEASQTQATTVDDADFASSFNAPTQAQAPIGRAPVRVTSSRPTGLNIFQPAVNTAPATDPAAAQRAFESGNIGGAGGAYAAGSDKTRAAFDEYHDNNQGGVDWSKVANTAKDVGTFALDPVGGTVRAGLNAAGVDPRLAYLGQMATGPAGALVGGAGLTLDARARGQTAYSTAATPSASAGTAGAGGAPPAGTTGEQLAGAGADVDEAENQFQDVQTENAAENDSLFTGAMDRYDALSGGDYLASDQARQYQQEGLQQQRMLLEKMLDFDSNQYATQFADQALARQIALGRQGTSAAAQQAGMFAAMEGAPALYAEGRRAADEMEIQRLGLAESAAKSFGELGTMTRGQDETRAQFDAQLPLEIADSVAALTQGKMSLNQEESTMFAEIWMDFAQLQSVYAGLSSQEQMAWWDDQTKRRGQDKQWEAIKAQIKANGAVSDKDILNAVFQLGGGLLSVAGGMGAA